ncbi:baseplate J/gp47 family protein [Dasania marina]|uniref:baseplate J/gp47 family protein n=1 Tax=Dasania marina TaxID=471499 RepID=UPI00036FC20D|nr:baseplate J/gp47 family protein [Dasania marina]
MADFEALVKSAGIPTSHSELKTKLATEAASAQYESLGINNNSEQSPFWRVVEALITVPTLWLIKSLITTLLPNLYVKTAVDESLDDLAWGYDLTRKLATKTQGSLQFSRVDSSGTLTIEVGSIIKTNPINGTVYQVELTESCVFADGESVKTATVIATQAGAGHNLAAGYFNALLAPISGVSVTNLSEWISSAGADTESNDQLRLRCQNQFSALNQYHTNAVYTSLITSFAGIGVNNVFFDANAPRGPGSADAYLLLDSGEPDAPLLAAVQAHIMDDGNHGHGDDMQVKAMPALLQTLTATLWFNSHVSSEETTQITTDAEQFIRCAFRENTNYNASQTMPHSLFSFSKLGAELHAQFSGLASVDFSLSDISSGLEVPRLSTLTMVTP